MDGTADARINAGSSLFSNMEPYAYGESARLSTQTAYLANPHNIQKIVPQLLLPAPNQSSEPMNFMLPHAVSDGDIAFSIKFATDDAKIKNMSNSRDYFRQGGGRAVDYICNLATVNYILRGFFTLDRFVNPAWLHFAAALGLDKEYIHVQKQLMDLQEKIDTGHTTTEAEWDKISSMMTLVAEEFIRDHFRPLGVVIGSEKQGGQHQGSNTAVTWPVAFIVTISIDGRNENLCNYWRAMDISSGSELGFSIQVQTHSTYSLNYSKQLVTKSFGEKVSTPQICPCKNHDFVKRDRKDGTYCSGQLPIMGYWQICMPQMMHQKVTQTDSSNDAASFHVGAVLQSTISITWVNFMWRHDDRMDLDKEYIAAMQHFTATGPTPMASIMISRTANVMPQYLTTAGNPRAVALDTRVNTMAEDRKISRRGVVRKAVQLTESELLERGFPAPFKIQRVSVVHEIACMPPINSEIVITEAIHETTVQPPPVTKRGKTNSKKKESSLTTAEENTITRL